jgi:large subunit ribosomal protein L22
MAQIETKKTTPAKIAVAKKVPAVKKSAPVKTEVKTPEIIVPSVKNAKYINKNLKVSPRKLRLTVNAVKKMSPSEAVTRLKFTNSNSARLLAKCIEDAIASATHNYSLLSQTLKFTEFRVDEGMKIKRMDKSHGSRFARGIIQKRHSRLTIILSGTIQS